MARGPRAGDEPTAVKGTAGSPETGTVHVTAGPHGTITLPDGRAITLDRGEALRDTLPRWRSALQLARGLPQPELAH